MTYDLDAIFTAIKSSSAEFIAVVGPTCTGKTGLSLEIAEKFQIPVINADSRLIFAEMNIGTAKPNLHELERAKHYLIDLKKPNQDYSAGDYRNDFDELVQNLRAQKQSTGGNELNSKVLAVVVGGTGLYLRSALENLDMPDVSRDKDLREELNQLELEDLQKMLENLDPEAPNQVDMPNKVRVIRAIEIVKNSGKALAENRSKKSEPRYQVKYIGLNFSSRRKLYDLINYRVIKMIKKGLVHEAEALLEKYGRTQVLESTIGYKEILGYFDGQYSLSEARRRIQKNTRVYAKRQMTWFKQNQAIEWFISSN